MKHRENTTPSLQERVAALPALLSVAFLNACQMEQAEQLPQSVGPSLVVTSLQSPMPIFSPAPAKDAPKRDVNLVDRLHHHASSKAGQTAQSIRPTR